MKTAASPINRGFFRWLCLGLLVLVAACNDDQGASGGNTPDPTPKVRHFTTMELTPASARMRATIGDTVTMVMALSDTQHAVAHFEVFINNVSRFTADSTASTTFSWSTTAARVGDQTIKVVATTPDGKTDNHYDRVILASDRVPEPFGYRIVKTYPHDPAAFTQGLLFENGHLFESIGLKGQSALKEVELETGKAVRQVPMESNLFAEGLAVVDNRLVQLTYQAGVGFVYDKSSFNRIGQFSYLGEGWGITYDSTHLIMSNGKHILQLLDPQSMSKVGELEVWNDQKRVGNLNELEFIDGSIFANVWQTDKIVRIDPATGKVLAEIDLSGLLTKQERARADVLNGIAYDQENDRLFVTGKNWPKLFEIQLVPRS